jgi:hypothetical protein
MLEPFGPSLYVADGPEVCFHGFPYPTRMAVARLSDGSAWVWSPIALTQELADEVQAIGAVRHIVSPNKLHYLFLQAWAEHWPDARLYAPPGLARKKPALHFHAELDGQPISSWQGTSITSSSADRSQWMRWRFSTAPRAPRSSAT